MPHELQSLNDRIAERIGKDLVDLIPQDQWQQMVDNEIRKFKTEIAPKIIQEMIEAEFRKDVGEQLDELTNTSEWNNISNEYTNKALIEFIGASGGIIFGTMMAPPMQRILADLRQNLHY